MTKLVKHDSGRQEIPVIGFKAERMIGIDRIKS